MEPLPHGYTNVTTGDGRVVTKRYLGPDAASRCAREAAALRGLAGRLPVPPLVDCAEGTLTAGFMPGAHGQDLIDGGLAEPVLRACGRMLRRIHAVPPDEVVGTGPRSPGHVLVHGDYGPNNLLLDPRPWRVTAILDWEWARAGDPVDDLAWCEWIVRTHHPAHVPALAGLWAGYGWRPDWTARQRAMAAQASTLVEFCERWQPGGAGAAGWRRHLAVMPAWTDLPSR